MGDTPEPGWDLSSDGMGSAQEGQPWAENCWAGALVAALDTRDQGQQKSEILLEASASAEKDCNQENTDFWLGPNKLTREKNKHRNVALFK